MHPARYGARCRAHLVFTARTRRTDFGWHDRVRLSRCAVATSWCIGLLVAAQCVAACGEESPAPFYAARSDEHVRDSGCIECTTGENDEDGGTGGSILHQRDDGGATQPSPMPALEGQFTSANSIGRTGSFYLAAGYNTRPLPMLVAYHGTGGSGADMVSAFRELAATNGFIIVAPDSRKSPDGAYNWQVGDQTGDVTEDYMHALDCVAELRAKTGVQIDETHVLAAGYSGGGSSAPYIATNESAFTAFAVLHGGVIEGSIGSNVIPGWFSTGNSDSLRPPALVRVSVDYMVSLGFADVTFEIYPGGHGLASSELSAVIAWWLGA